VIKTLAILKAGIKCLSLVFRIYETENATVIQIEGVSDLGLYGFDRFIIIIIQVLKVL